MKTILLIASVSLLGSINLRADDPSLVPRTPPSILLSEAQDYQQVCRFHLANKRYQQALLLDAKNAEAIAGLREVEQVLEGQKAFEKKEQPYEISYPQRKLYYPMYHSAQHHQGSEA